MPPERYAVIGDPIAHSLSPAMHAAAFSDLGLEATYDAMQVMPPQLPDAVALLTQDGYRGFNVTIPHKERIGRLLDSIDRTAAQIGAVNTVVNDGGTLTGYNTDSEGFVRALLDVAPALRGGRATVFGAGGAARAVLHALTGLEMSVAVVVRNPDRAAALSRRHPGAIDIVLAGAPSLGCHVHESDLLVNTTPLGMAHAPNESPLPDDFALDRHTVVFDLIYGRMTPFLAQARTAGCRTLDGLEMLIFQGAASFRLWTGREPNVEVMRLACLTALEEGAAC